MKNASGATDSATGEAAGASAGGRDARAGGAGEGEEQGAHDVTVPQDQPARGAASGAAHSSDAQAKLQLVVDRDANQREVAIDLQTMEDDEAPVPHPYDDANPSASKLKPPSNAPSPSPHVGGGIDLGTVGEAEGPNHPSQYEVTSQKTRKMTGSVEASPVHPPTPDEHAALSHDSSLDEAKAKERRMRTENASDSVDEPTLDESDAQPTQRDASALSSTLSAIFGRRQQRKGARAPNPIAPGGDRGDPFASDAIAADVEAAETAEASPYLNDNDEICIPEATAVTPDEDLPVGTVVRPEKNSLTIAGRKIELRFVILAVIALLALAIVLAVTLTRKHRGTVGAPTSAPSVSLFPSSEPSTQPSLGPTTILQAQLMGVISNYSGGVVSSSFADSQSAHRRALQWLVDDQTKWLQEKRPLPDAELVERFVIALIYFSTYGDGWNQNEELYFITENHICNWRAGNKLKGGLPTEIGLLKELEALHLGNNDIEGSIPKSLGSLTNLTHLELQNNDLVGTAPGSLSNLKNLRSIDLSGNEMTGSLVDAGGMTELRNYNAAGNRFSGPVPESFSNISSLDILHVEFNQLTGDIDFMCDNLPPDYRLDCYGDKPEISCNCCPGCTFVSDEACDPGTEKALILEIYVGSEDSNFAWKVQEETSNYELSTIAAGGQYDDGEALRHQLCVAPGWYKITTIMDTPEPTYHPTSPYPTWDRDLDTEAPMPVSAPPIATKVPTPSPFANSNKEFCDSLTGREECNEQSNGKCMWDTGSGMCYANDLANTPPPVPGPPTTSWPTTSPTTTLSPTTTSPTQYTRLVYSIDGIDGVFQSIYDDNFGSGTLGPNEELLLPVGFFPGGGTGETDPPTISASPTTSAVPTSRPSGSSRPSSSNSPSVLTPFPTEGAFTIPPRPTPPRPTPPSIRPPSCTTCMIKPAPCKGGRFRLNLTTDAFGMDTSYEVIDRNDDPILVSRTGFPSNTTVQEDACLKRSGCYDFVIYDQWDDGICCKQGRGSYEVYVDRIPYGSGGEFGTSETIFLGGTCGGNASGWLLAAGPSPTPITPFPSPSAITCLTRSECEEQMQSGGFVGFYTGAYADYGCFSKGDNLYWGIGGTEEQMAVSPLAGAKERVWCG